MSEEELANPPRGWKAATATLPIIFGVITSCIAIGSVLGILIAAPEIIG